MTETPQPEMPWNPPVPGTTWQPGSTVSSSEQVTEIEVGPLGRPTGNKGRRIVAIGAVTALIAAGGFAMVQVAGNGDDGGAASPKEAIELLIASVNNQDALGAMDMLLPGERRTFKQPMIDLVTELTRLEVLDTTAKLDNVGGADFLIEIKDMGLDEAAPDIVTVDVSGTAKASVDAAKLPIGKFLIDNAMDGERPDVTDSTTAEFGGTTDNRVELTTVKRNGRWYVSLWYSVAELARRNASAELPTVDEAIKPVGAESPEQAVEQMINAIADLDLQAVIAGMNPNEAEALQRYAPIFLVEGQDAVDGFVSEVNGKVSVSGLTYETTKDGDEATVDVKTFTVDGSADGSTGSLTYDGDCTTVTFTQVDSEPTEQKTCQKDAAEELNKSGLGFLARAGRDAGVRVSKVDGKWYVSPIGTMTNALVSVLKNLKKADLKDLVEGLGSAAQGAVDDFGVNVPGLPVEDDPFGTVVLPITPSDQPLDAGSVNDVPLDDESFDTLPPLVDDTLFPPSTDSTDFPTNPALEECYAQFEDFAVASKCFQDGLAAGTILPNEVDVSMRYPECGLAEASWKGYYDITDADFIALITQAETCFAAKVASGEITDYDVPYEVIKPACYQGKNIFAVEDFDARTKLFDDYFACAYA